MSQSAGDERVRAVTYVPRRQKETWTEHADRLGMSQAEFLRTMVQAGRRGFDVDPESADPGTGAEARVEEPASADPNPRGQGREPLEDRIIAVLSAEGHADWDDLVTAVTADVEDRLETAIETLQREDRIAHSPQRGYRMVEDGD